MNYLIVQLTVHPPSEDVCLWRSSSASRDNAMAIARSRSAISCCAFWTSELLSFFAVLLDC